MSKKISTEKEFAVGKNSIGWISSDFKKYFDDTSFEKKGVPVFQKLLRSMSDVEIEKELTPGLCELGDILAFLENPPEETKDGYWNLFYTESCVVDVDWDEFRGYWCVNAWERDGRQWDADARVFSPATESSNTQNSTLETLDTLTLEKAIEVVKEAGYKIIKEL